MSNLYRFNSEFLNVLNEKIHFERQSEDWIYRKIDELFESPDEECQILAFQLLIATANMTSNSAIVESITKISFKSYVKRFLGQISNQLIKILDLTILDRFMIAMVGVFEQDFLNLYHSLPSIFKSRSRLFKNKSFFANMFTSSDQALNSAV